MKENGQLDVLDRQILGCLLKNARSSYAEMGQTFGVSGGTVHGRVERLREAGIILGSKIRIDPKSLGYDVCCFMGVNLKSAKDCKMVLKYFNKFEEIVEAYTTTGSYSIFIKVMCKSIEDLNQFLVGKIQTIREIQSTETIITLSESFKRDVVP